MPNAKQCMCSLLHLVNCFQLLLCIKNYFNGKLPSKENMVAPGHSCAHNQCLLERLILMEFLVPDQDHDQSTDPTA